VRISKNQEIRVFQVEKTTEVDKIRPGSEDEGVEKQMKKEGALTSGGERRLTAREAGL